MPLLLVENRSEEGIDPLGRTPIGNGTRLFVEGDGQLELGRDETGERRWELATPDLAGHGLQRDELLGLAHHLFGDIALLKDRAKVHRG